LDVPINTQGTSGGRNHNMHGEHGIVLKIGPITSSFNLLKRIIRVKAIS
jgi:hypothetical protein